MTKAAAQPPADDRSVAEVTDVAEAAQETTEATRSAIDGLSQAAGAAAQRAGVAAQRAGEVLTDAAGDVASTVSAHAPAVIDASRTTVGVAAREVRAASSRDLMLGTVFSTGLASGLLLARGPQAAGADGPGTRVRSGRHAAEPQGRRPNGLQQARDGQRSEVDQPLIRP